MKKIFIFIFEILKIVVLALMVVIPIRHFLFQPFIVRGNSMEPNFENGDYLLVDEISFRFRDPQRGEVIVFNLSGQRSNRFIKRIIGLPGEEIEIKDGKIIISNKNGNFQILDESSYLPSNFTPRDVKISLKEKEFFVLGDNRPFSLDSRSFGAIPRENIIGRVFFRVFPFKRLSKIEIPNY